MASWHAKPSGAYSLDSTEANDNALMVWNILGSEYNYTEEAAAGVCGNMYAESGLNPWRWGNDVAYSNAYGLIMFTGSLKTDWFNSSYAIYCNYSTIEITAGASPLDGMQQVRYIENIFPWVSNGWRSYWDPADYPALYAQWQRCVSTYGSGNGITRAQFSQINNVSDASLVYLCCQEGPAIPNASARETYSSHYYNVITGHPPTPVSRGINIPIFIATGIILPLQS